MTVMHIHPQSNSTKTVEKGKQNNGCLFKMHKLHFANIGIAKEVFKQTLLKSKKKPYSFENGFQCFNSQLLPFF